LETKERRLKDIFVWNFAKNTINKWKNPKTKLKISTKSC
jgi:hypothetical protein